MKGIGLFFPLCGPGRAEVAVGLAHHIRGIDYPVEVSFADAETDRGFA
jgi:hypothetical protein